MDKDTRSAMKNQTIGYVAGAFSLVAGLAWNDAVKALIESLFPLDSSSIWVKFIYAILITIVVVLLTQYIFRVLSDKN